MRLGEIQALNRASIKEDACKLLVCRTYSKHTKTIVPNTKGRKSRVVPVSGNLLRELVNLANSHSHDLVFCQDNGLPFPQEEIRKIFSKACRNSGVKRIPFHSLRHSFATHFLTHGGGTLELKKILGHSRVETTEKYTHLTETHLAIQISNLHLPTESESRSKSILANI